MFDTLAFSPALLLPVLYFLPLLYAVSRQSTKTHAVFVLNLFLGWTVIGWFVALVIALTSDTRAPVRRLAR